MLASKTKERSRASLEGEAEPGLATTSIHGDQETGMDIAVLGMGRMGRALAARLLEGGHSVTVWNHSKGKAAEIVSAGGREASSVADAVDGVDVVITMLANDDAVREVALGKLRPSIGDKTIYVDCSTVSPKLSGELAEAFPARFVVLPVLGSPLAVRAGQADRKSTRLNSSHSGESRMPSSA